VTKARPSDAKGGSLSTRSQPKPLRIRDEIIEQRKAAWKAYAEQTEIRQRAETAKGATRRALLAAETARDCGDGTEAELKQAEEAVQKAADIYTKSLARANHALDRTKTLDQRLEELYGDHFVEFASEADKRSKEADEAINEMISAYRRAQAAWATAQAAWTPVCHAVRIANMGAFPLTDHMLSPVIGGWVAKPPTIEVLDVDENEAVEEAALLEGIRVEG
jgi:hypothetical protein